MIIHNSGSESSTLSSDVLHLYKDPQSPIMTNYNEKKQYTGEDYQKLIFGNDATSRAVLYTVNYDNDWTLEVTPNPGSKIQTKLAQEPTRTGLILLLNTADFNIWDKITCDQKGTTLQDALKGLSLIEKNQELRDILGMK